MRVTIDEYARRLRYGLIITIHSILEERLTKICRLLSGHGAGVRVTYDQLENVARPPRGLARAKKFLEDVLGFSSPATEWDEMEELRRLRNAIVHQDSYDPNSGIQLQRTGLLAIDPSGRVAPSPECCRSIVEKVAAFFERFQEVNQDKVEAFLDAKSPGRTAASGSNREHR